MPIVAVVRAKWSQGPYRSVPAEVQRKTEPEEREERERDGAQNDGECLVVRMT
jgi:hypothetical protein